MNLEEAAVPTYNVTVTTHANAVHTITAANKDEAIEMAEEESLNLCHYCAGGWGGSPEVDLGDDWEVTSVTEEP